MDLHRFSAFDYMKLVVGSALVAAAFQFFTFPNSIVSGGVTGIAQIIRLLTGIPVGVLSILINIPIFYLGWRHRLGTRRLVLALCVMALISVLIDALALTVLVVTDEPMLGAVYGGVLNGAGYGLIYTTSTTGGGTDIVAKMLRRRYPYINFGTLLFGMNVVVVLTFAFLFKKYDSCMYTMIEMFISSKVVNLVLYGPGCVGGVLHHQQQRRRDQERHHLHDGPRRHAAQRRGRVVGQRDAGHPLRGQAAGDRAAARGRALGGRKGICHRVRGQGRLWPRLWKHLRRRLKGAGYAQTLHHRHPAGGTAGVAVRMHVRV